MPSPGRDAAPGPASPRRRLVVGLLVNPIAGLGGPGAFKGSDTTWRDALAAGYAPRSPDRARRLVAEIGDAVEWVTVPGDMGESEVREATAAARARPRIVLADRRFDVGTTTPDDTAAAALALAESGIDLLLFAGGDGTAADVCRAVGDTVPSLGVPAGVKITSPVFAHDVEEAAWLVRSLRPGFETVLRDVTDLDEDAYRAGRVDVRLVGALRVPLSPAVQSGKLPTGAETPLDGLVERVLTDWDNEARTLHLVGAGSVCLAIKKQFWGTPSLLGVDAIQGNRIVETDLSDRRIAAAVDATLAAGGRVRLVLSTIGGQGMLLGRGTQVYRPDVLRRIGWDNIVVVAPPEKLLGLRGLHVDSGDPDFDAAAPKHIRVVTGYNEYRMVRLLHGAP